ncbi:hypothetical protein [Pricia sp.]|uniref:hypothetical protein n=1 Tax=Pricia sp. TaxID=2268138 RepID=UPI0035944EE9
MKSNYFFIAILLALFFAPGARAQEAQKDFINYQGVARNAEGQLMAEEGMTLGIALKFGAANAPSQYEENHSLTTDANGVFSLKIGNGNTVAGDYNNLPWGGGATFMTVTINGNAIGTTEMMAVPYAIRSGDGDNQSAEEVPYNNAVSGLTANTAQAAIDELATSDTGDGDNDPANEIQTLSFNSGTNELSLSDGNSVIIPSGGTDADADPTNEIQTLGFDPATNRITLTDGGEITLPSGATDADADPANEFQNLSLSGTNLQISDGTGVDLGPILPPGGTDDQNAGEVPYDNTTTGLTATNAQAAIDELVGGSVIDADSDPTNEIDVTRNHGLLVGDGGLIDGLVGTADGQVAKWDAALGNWVVGTDEIGGGAGSSLWNEIATGISYNAGFVGIETNDPTAKLDVNGDIRSRALIGTGERNVVADANGNLIVGAAGGRSSLWNEDGDNIFFDTGNVGIGLATPSSLQHIHSTDFESNSQYTTTSTGSELNDGLWVGMRNEVFSGPTGRIINLEDGPLNLGTNGLPRMTISNAGNVGIGKTDPTGKLHISKNYDPSPFMNLETTAGDRADIRFSKEGSTSSWDQIAGIRTDAASGTMSYYFNDSGTSNHIMTLRGDNKVGINTFNPQAALDVNGDIKTSGEVNRPSTGATNLLPVAYGTIEADGSTANGSGNFTVRKYGEGAYEINVTGEVIGYSSHTMTVSRGSESTAFGFISHLIQRNNMGVFTANTSGASIDARFSFVIYKP